MRRAAIPKSGGGERELGIPTVLDRFIQQALLQVLQPLFDPTFSDAQLRLPARTECARRGASRRKRYVQEGRGFVVDVDLEKFFDRVNHDVLMGRLAKRIADRRVLRLIRRYLEAGVLAHGVVMERHEGTPQGGPLSPLLANVLLDEVDKELERRGHAFVRYADDCNVYVRTQRAGERVMALAAQAVREAPKLRVNEAKSAVTRATKAQVPRLLVLGRPRDGSIRRRVAPQAIARMKERVRELTRRSAGRSLAQMCKPLGVYLTGWKDYFRLAETPRRVRRPRRMGPPPPAGGAAQALEAGTGHLPRADRSRDARRRGQTGRRQRPALVAQLGDGAQHGAAQHCSSNRLGVPRACQRNLNPSNRPVRTRMPGGVAGDAEA